MWRFSARRRSARRSPSMRSRREGGRSLRMRNCLTCRQAFLKFGTSVVAVYEGQWFLADVAENKVNVGHGYTKLSYWAIKGANCFARADKPDIMVSLIEDIILSEVNVVPRNNRGHAGLT
jgi:hypothetical protein